MSEIDNIDALERQLAELQMGKGYNSYPKVKKIPPAVPPKKKAQPQVPHSSVVGGLREPSYSSRIPSANSSVPAYAGVVRNNDSMLHGGKMIHRDYANMNHIGRPEYSQNLQGNNYTPTYSNVQSYRRNLDPMPSPPPPPPPPPMHAHYYELHNQSHDEYLPPPSPVSSNYSELVRATSNINYNPDRSNYAHIYQNDYPLYEPSQSSTYESLYEPINPRPPSQLSSHTNNHLPSHNLNVPRARTPLSKEAEVDALTNLLVESISDSQDLDVFGVCVKCGDKVVGEASGCTAMGNMYHVKCFCCQRCNGNLQGKPFYSVDGQPYCEKDYYETL